MASQSPNKPFRILKREPKPDISTSSATGRRLESIDADAPLDRHAVYESARAEILGADFDIRGDPKQPLVPDPGPRGKAQYRGLDESQFDPDYVRVSPFVTSWTRPQSSHPERPEYAATEQYPSLSQAYSTGRPKPPH